jgi:AcrR family transcriptional regulator
MTSLRHNGRAAEAPREPRDAYLDAARDCILDVGWRRTTLTEVARRAGVSRMTIYRTWADMPTLLGDLMTREWARTIDAQVESDRGKPAIERITHGIVGTVQALRVNELFVRIVEVDPELILPYLFSRRGRSQELVLAVTTEAIKEGQARGEIRRDGAVGIARALLLAAQGFVLSAHTMVDDEVSLEELDAELELVVSRMLERP